jgi:hypothetical protein
MTVKERKRFAVKQDEDERKGYDTKWSNLNLKLKSKMKDDYHEPSQPFAPSTLIRDYNDLYHKIYDKEKYVNM